MSARRLAAVLAAGLAGILFAATWFLRSRRIGVRLTGQDASFAAMPAPQRSTVTTSPPQANSPSPSQENVYTNEMQAANLARQKKTLGIQGVMTDEWDARAARAALMDQIARAQSPGDAASAIEQLSSMNAAAQERAGRRPPVPLAGSTPKLLAQPGGASAIGAGEPISSVDYFAVSGGSPGQSRVLRDRPQWSAFWSEVFPGRPVPSVDFTRDEIALVIAGPKPEGDGLEILSSGEEAGTFTIRYRQTRSLVAGALGAGSARWLCAVKKIPRVAGSVEFKEAR